jgi:hypothetical protein
MGARLLVVMEIASQNPPQRRLVAHHDVIEASRRIDPISRPHALHEGNHCSSENRISIPPPILGRFPGNGFSNLLRSVLQLAVPRMLRPQQEVLWGKNSVRQPVRSHEAALQRPRVEDDEMLQAVPAARADQAFDVGRDSRGGGGEHFFYRE